MKKLASATLLLVVSMSAGAAAECPEVPDHSDDLTALLEKIRAAPTEQDAREFSSQMWEFWRDAPDEQSQSALDRGMLRLNSGDFLGAIDDFNTVIEYCPLYAEGYNQRAFAHYLLRDYSSALPDLERAIELSPNHVAAISGRALTLLGLQRIEEAREALSQALMLNPWLAERHLAGPGGPLEPLGEEI